MKGGHERGPRTLPPPPSPPIIIADRHDGCDETFAAPVNNTESMQACSTPCMRLVP